MRNLDHQAVKDLIDLGQDELPSIFKRKPLSMRRLLFAVFILLLLGCPLTLWIYEIIESSKAQPKINREVKWGIVAEYLKIVAGIATVFITTLIATNRWQQRSISFAMIQELNSNDFYDVRRHLWAQMQQAIRNRKDMEHMDGWFPYTQYYIRNIEHPEPHKKRTQEDNLSTHALANMTYFVVRFANYHKCSMINKTLTRHLFHFFFSHYQVVLLEFAEKLIAYREQLKKEGFNYDERWDLTSEDIRLFFRIVGLGDKLPANHTYLYFPSLQENRG